MCGSSNVFNILVLNGIIKINRKPQEKNKIGLNRIKRNKKKEIKCKRKVQEKQN